MLQFLEDLFEDSVVEAPGASTGLGYATWIGLCFTAAPSEQMAIAIRLLAERLAIAALRARDAAYGRV